MFEAEESLLNLLPDEILALILNFLHNYRDLFNVSETSHFSQLCGWEFWKQKALKELKVDNWYFDLPILQNRSISGKGRFLEILSKFEIVPESIARIEEGDVVGIYFESIARHLAEEQGNVRMFKPENWRLEFGTYRQKDIRNLPYYESKVDNYRHFQWECYCVEQIAFKAELRAFGFCTSEPRGPQFGCLSKREWGNRPPPMRKIIKMVSKHLSKGNYQELADNVTKDHITTLSHLAFIGDDKWFPTLEEIFKSVEDRNKIIILSFSAASGKPEQFSKLLELSPLTSNDRQALLYRAYEVCDPKIIEIIENNERNQTKGEIITLSPDEKLNYLSRSVTCPCPVRMYQIIEKMIQTGELKEDMELFFWDIDILMLLEKEKIISIEIFDKFLEQYDLPINFIKYCIFKFDEKQKEKYRQQIDEKNTNDSRSSIIKRLLQ